MIRAAKPEDLPHILKITQACARDLISKNIFQWNENYPNLAAFQKDLDREELFVYEAQEKILGAVVVSDFMDAVYEPIKWKAPTGKNIYIHRLCVHPNHQGKGLGEMKFLRNVLLLATFLVFVPCLLWSQYLELGLKGIWIAFALWMLTRGVALLLKFRRKFLPLLQNTYF
jgi:GNAT superfamily N-acetyltransferase